MAAAAPAMCPAPRQTSDSARGWSGSVTTTKSQCCRLDADGARQAASAMRSRSPAGTGSVRYWRTLRRARMASQVSNGVSLAAGPLVGEELIGTYPVGVVVG